MTIGIVNGEMNLEHLLEQGVVLNQHEEKVEGGKIIKYSPGQDSIH